MPKNEQEWIDYLANKYPNAHRSGTVFGNTTFNVEVMINEIVFYTPYSTLAFRMREVLTVQEEELDNRTTILTSTSVFTFTL